MSVLSLHRFQISSYNLRVCCAALTNLVDARFEALLKDVPNYSIERFLLYCHGEKDVTQISYALFKSLILHGCYL
jgi:hypothetical protein